MLTEAMEAAKGNSLIALANLYHQVRWEETQGVIAMYRAAAISLGCTPEQCDNVEDMGRAENKIGNL
jgi:hypothetical protein